MASRTAHKPKTVSVVIPTRNYGRYLGEAIHSLRRQDYPDWECVVVDDGSTDGTVDTAAALAASDRRIAYVRQAASGPSAARNAGLAATDGEFVQFLDADDLLGRHKLQHQVEVFARHPEADIVYGGVRYFFAADTDDAERTARRWTEGPTRGVASGRGESVLAALIDDNFMVMEAPLIRRSLIEKVGGFDPRIRKMEDWEFWLRCALAGAYFVHDGAGDDDSLPHVRIHGSSSSQDQIAMHEAAVQVRRGIENQLATPGLHRLNRTRIHEHLAVVGMLEGLSGRLGLGMRCLLKAGFGERKMRWVAWALLMPAVRHRPGSWMMSRLRAVRARRRGEEVRDWQAHWP
jgi:glycosyltransferase involved in cell wall biosynthesis